MGRKIGENVRNELNIHDPVSGSVITLYYRLPTSEERIAYLSAQFERDGKTIRFKISEARQKYGLMILIGFKEGSFEIPVAGKDSWAPISSDPKSVNFDADWKDLVFKYASDLVELLAAHVFEGQRIVSSQSDAGAQGAAPEGFSEKNS